MKRTLSRLFWLLIMALSAVASSTNLPFLRDDFQKAQAQALQRKLPIFIEIWAPW